MQNSDKNVIQPKLSCTADENVKGTNALENVLIFYIMYILDILPYYEPAISMPGIYSRKVKTYILKRT